MIYIARAGNDGPVKIGWSADPSFRLTQLQAWHWEEMKILRTIKSKRRSEWLIHSYFEAAHIRGEWFHFRDEMLTFSLKAIRKQTLSLMEGRIMPSWRCRGVTVPKAIQARAA